MIGDAPVDRRTVLRGLALGAGAAALAGCSSGHPARRAAASSTSLAGRTTTTAPLTTWKQLQNALTGRLVMPAASTYLTDLQLYDPRFDGVRPAAIAFCANPSDVQRCIAFARGRGIPFTARSGGHSYAGYSTGTGLVIDVTGMHGISLEAGNRASIGAGARLIDVYTNLNNHGVSIPGGSCPTVGIAGLAMGGGIGVVARKHGMTCDAMTGVQIVTADSRVVNANSATNSDLYWASRGGGGGNFGIATRFNFATFPTAPVALFTLRWPFAAAADVLAGWMSWVSTTPDELWSNCIIAASTPTSSISIGGIWLGPQSQVSPFLDRLAAATGATPSSRFLETIPLEHAMYVEAGCAQLDQSACHVKGETAQAQLTRGPFFAGSEFIDGPLSHAGINVIIDTIAARTASRRPGTIAFDAYGGAINRVAGSATAFVHRHSLCCAQYSVNYSTAASAADVSEYRTWLKQFRTAMRPYVSGAAYQNYIDPTLPNSLTAYYGSNLPRLKTVKKKWDPDNAFHFAQSIPLP